MQSSSHTTLGIVKEDISKFGSDVLFHHLVALNILWKTHPEVKLNHLREFFLPTLKY